MHTSQVPHRLYRVEITQNENENTEHDKNKRNVFFLLSLLRMQIRRRLEIKETKTEVKAAEFRQCFDYIYVLLASCTCEAHIKVRKIMMISLRGRARLELLFITDAACRIVAHQPLGMKGGTSTRAPVKLLPAVAHITHV